MTTLSHVGAAEAGELAQLSTALPLSSDVPEIAALPRVMLLVDADSVSWGLGDGPAGVRASDLQVQQCLDVVQATARSLDPMARARCASSSETAAHHLGVLTASGNGIWSIRRGRDGADQVLVEELDTLITARQLATRPHRPRSARLADLVILVGGDHAYAPAVRQLRLLGLPTWLVVPGRCFVAASLFSCACAVSFLGPRRPSSAPRVRS